MVGLDVDSEDPAILAALEMVLPPSPVVKAGAKGETRFYYAPGLASQSWSIDGKWIVEIIGAGRQTVLPPTIHPDTGKPYRWLGPEALEDLRPQELPQLPDDFADQITSALTPFGCEEPRLHVADGDGEDDSPHRQLNNAALANLPAWVPALHLYKCRSSRKSYEAVAVWRPSSTGRPDQQRTRNLKISPKGIRDFGADLGYTPLDLVTAALACDLDAAFAFLSERLGWSTGEPLAIMSGIGEAPVGNGCAAGTGEVAAENGLTVAGNGQGQAAAGNRVDPLEPFTHIPGALGDVIDWIVSTARRPNRVLALGAAIVTLGTLIGRRVAGPTRSATHLYVVTIAPATAGKDHPRRCILPLLDAAKAGVHVHLGDITSQSGFNRVMKTTPLSAVVIDEIAGFLGRITCPKSSHWERRLAEKLREQWSCSFGAIGTMTSAEQHDMRIECPAMSIFGTSTSDEFWSVLQGTEVKNGLFSRFLVLESNRHNPDQDPDTGPFEVPAALKTRLGELYCWDGNPLATARLNDPGVKFKPYILPWTDRYAKECYRDLTQRIERELGDNASTEPYLGRVAETAVRLATIRAAGRLGNRAGIELADMEWGAGLAYAATMAMMERSIDVLAVTVRGEFVDRLLRAIERRDEIPHRDLLRLVGGRYNTREVSDMLNQAIAAGLLARLPNGSYRSTRARKANGGQR
jgi:hypothetical protein